MQSESDHIIVALGSNLGDSRKTLETAISELQKLSAAPLLRSSFWITPPVDCPPGSPDFLNAVVALRPLTGETPESLLPKLQALERRFGRTTKKILNEPRPLDLDLIAFGRGNMLKPATGSTSPTRPSTSLRIATPERNPSVAYPAGTD